MSNFSSRRGHSLNKSSKKQSRRKNILNKLEKSSRRKPSPYRSYNRNEARNDFQALRSYIRTTPSKTFKRSRVGYAASNRFFQKSRMNTAGSDKKESCLKKWKKGSPALIKKWELYKKKYKSAKDLSGFLIYLNKAPAQFPPSIAGMVYKYFKANHIFDPFAGWGDRCIAAMAAGISYTGADSNTSLESSYQKMIQTYWPRAKSEESKSHLFFTDKNRTVELYFRPCQEVPIDGINFDLVFSSPPFWKNGKLVEKYPKCEKDYEIFMTSCLLPMMKKFRKRNVNTCLHIPYDMYRDLSQGITVNNVQEEGIGECDEIIQFSSGKWGKTSENPNNNIYCWKWGVEIDQDLKIW